ncbi:hypothetical protein D7B24_006512 [Verticillium nonalfalfae]|uniref:Uncharacterized protein n=1 Tax=Verticillium nonalfalfae TaxID=1051616 RepID=A0A3M9Y936_9PEZI|nr:uncharacterized protein D7B24_006512 [Verticillium nonalfalfae]RNJ56989.1 hypothetical protein D7B24_006512 [Verticillium nonalfalfae]
MTILILEPDVHDRARALIQRSAAQHAEDGRPLSHIHLGVDMPLLENLQENPLPCREPVEETTEVSAFFSAQLHAMYEQLAVYHARPAASLADAKLAPIDEEKGIQVEFTVGCQSFTRFPHCEHLIYHARRLTLHDPETLPVLPFVRKLRFLPGSGPRQDFYFSRVRPVSLHVPLACLAHLPGVAEIDCPWLWERLPFPAAGRPMRHFTRVWEGPWRDARHEFGASMMQQKELLGLPIPATLTKARLWFWQPGLACEDNQALAMPDLVTPAEQDPLSVGLRTLAAQLQELDLRAFLTEHIFPSPDAPSSKQWLNLRRLTIEFHPLRPDGRWYFVGPRGEDPHPKGFAISKADHYPPLQTTTEDEEVDEQWNEDPEGGEEVDAFPDVFRTQPSPETIEPLLLAFGSAVKNMGALEDAELFAYLAWCPSDSRAEEYGDEAPYDSENGVHRWGVRHLAAKAGDEDTVEGVVQWQIGDWRPSQSVLDLFGGLGRQEWLDFTFEEQRKTKPYSVA